MTDGQRRIFDRYTNDPKCPKTGGVATAFDCGLAGHPNRFGKTSLAWAAWKAGDAVRRKGGRPESADPRIPLPFRLRSSVVEKARRLGRDRIEYLIARAKES